MSHRGLAMGLLLLLPGCSPDIESFGRAPPLSPVGSGIRSTDTVSAVSALPAFEADNGSWIGGNADFFRDFRARRNGDLITVHIAINDKASLNNTSNRSRKAAAGGDLGFTYDLMGVVGADVNGNGDVSSTSSASGQGNTTRSEKIELSVAAIVTSVLPNGYLVIEGSQEVVVNFEQRTLHIAGIIRPGDIAPDNSISYEKIAEARISYGGRGRLMEVQQPGWSQQLWDRISPF
ncbi:MAG: flagellar basal body L-ring protein FlgH [Alphaproteobacteria bacterium]|nr:flagellar basal body L-ring protein FlgH [Alphaproteobacteria bacterium]